LEYRPEQGGSEDHPIMTILSPKNCLQNNNEEKGIISASKLSKRWIKWSTEFLDNVRSEGELDDKYKKELNHLLENGEQDQNNLHQEEGILYRKLKLWVPSRLRLEVCESEYDSKVGCHMGQDETKELIRRNFWWPGMNDEIVKYILLCAECQNNKAARHKSYGLLQPLDLAYTPWSSIAMDFITDLPLSDGCNQL
jgi:hypothetical protein